MANCPFRRWLSLSVAMIPLTAAGAGLPRVAPPGPGMAGAPGLEYSRGLDARFGRRLEQEYGPPAQVSRSDRPVTAIRPTPSGALTDTGVPLTGWGGALRAPSGGLWNCTPGGCFSPDGRFFPLYRRAPPIQGNPAHR